MKRTLRALSLMLCLLTLLSVAAPAMAASKKPALKPETLYISQAYIIDFVNVPKSAKLVSLKSSKPDIVEVRKYSSSLLDHNLIPLKPGKSRITVKYKAGGKTTTLSATYTVKAFPKAVTSVKFNGKAIKPTDGARKYMINDFTGTSATITVTPAKGWKIDKKMSEAATGPMDDPGNERDTATYFTPVSGKTFKIKKDYYARAIFALTNAKKEVLYYDIIIIR